MRCHNVPSDLSVADGPAPSALPHLTAPRDTDVHRVLGTAHLPSDGHGLEADGAVLVPTDTTRPKGGQVNTTTQSPLSTAQLWPDDPVSADQQNNTADPQTGSSGTSTYLDISNTGFIFQDPAWLLEGGVDFQTLCTSMASTWAAPLNIPESFSPHNTRSLDAEGGMTEHNLATAIARTWYSRFVQDPQDISNDEFFPCQSHVDDEYRERLSYGLRAGPRNISLPSADFLVRNALHSAVKALTSCRTYARGCISRGSIQCSRWCMRRRFDLRLAAHCCCCPCVLWGLCSLGPRAL